MGDFLKLSELIHVFMASCVFSGSGWGFGACVPEIEAAQIHGVSALPKLEICMQNRGSRSCRVMNHKPGGARGPPGSQKLAKDYK